MDIRYTDYFQEYTNFFGRALRLLKSVYGMTNYGKLFAGDLTDWLLEAGFIWSLCQISIYHKYAPDGSKIVVLSYVDDCVYWYTNEDLGDGLLILWERDFMWNSWYMHIGSC